MATLTSANSVFTLTVSPLYPVGIHIQGYATDDAFTAAEVEMVETIMGIDGRLSGGYTPYPVPLEFTLQADSDSNVVMDLIMDYQDAQREVLSCSASIMIPSLGMVYVFNNGFFKKGSTMSSAKKVMQPRRFGLEFNNVLRTPV